VFSELKGPQVNPLKVADVLDAATSKDWRDWEPEAIREFIDLPASEVQPLDKIMAVQVGLTNPDVFDTWTLFYATTVAFNHRRVNFEWLDKPSIPELAWSCFVLGGLNPAGSWGPDVLRFIGAEMLEEGLAFFPWIGGDGIVLCDDDHGEWAKGLTSPDLCALGKKVRGIWQDGELQDLEPSDVDDSDPLQAQLIKIVRAQKYIRMQEPR